LQRESAKIGLKGRFKRFSDTTRNFPEASSKQSKLQEKVEPFEEYGIIKFFKKSKWPYFSKNNSSEEKYIIL